MLVRIGALSGVVAEALEFCYELSVQGTPLEGSRLVVEEQPVVVFCPDCLENRVLEDSPLSLPDLRHPTSELVHGRELELVSMELVDHDEPTSRAVRRPRRQPSPPDPRGAAGPAEGQ